MLIEFDFGRLPDCLDEVLYLLDISGITPVIAHPERYEYFQKDIAGLKQLKEKGALLQVNASSISGIHGGKAQKAAKKILKQQLADVIGTDAHSPGVRGEYMDEALRLADKWSRTDYKNKFAENARYLLGEEGKDIV